MCDCVYFSIIFIGEVTDSFLYPHIMNIDMKID